MCQRQLRNLRTRWIEAKAQIARVDKGVAGSKGLAAREWQHERELSRIDASRHRGTRPDAVERLRQWRKLGQAPGKQIRDCHDLNARERPVRRLRQKALAQRFVDHWLSGFSKR